MARYEDPIVKCPFYSWEEGRQLCCEGVNAFSAVTVTFTTKEHMNGSAARKHGKSALLHRHWRKNG